jgi:hypothetical protein
MIDGSSKCPNLLRQTIDKCHLTVEEVAAVNANSQMTYFAKLKLTHPQCQLRIAPPSQDLV